ncbi:MAG: hypothetical protein PVG98_15600, partial [Chromatiales bacterium]
IGSPKNLKSLDDLREPDGSTFFEPSVIQRLADHFRTRGQRLLEGEDWPPRSEVTLETVAQTEAGAPRDAERLKAVWQRNSDTEVRILTQEEERDVAVLRGHEKPVQSVAFKPGVNGGAKSCQRAEQKSATRRADGCLGKGMSASASRLPSPLGCGSG